MTAVLFGSISTLADTSELQRAAFNGAFAKHGLGWIWEREDYREMLAGNGGAARIAAYAAAKGQTVDAEAVHEAKSELFQQSLAGAGISARPGVVETIRDARSQGLRVGLVTTTSRENIDSLLAAVRLEPSEFDVIVDSTSVGQAKPDPAAYAFALAGLGEQPGDCVAVEDNVGGVAAAVAAGLTCAAFPNENTAGQDFSAASSTVDRLDLVDLRELAHSSAL